jgi:hypothetical protein
VPSFPPAIYSEQIICEREELTNHNGHKVTHGRHGGLPYLTNSNTQHPNPKQTPIIETRKKSKAIDV